MKIMVTLIVYYCTIAIPLKVDAVCKDSLGSSYCNEGKCKLPGFPQHCRKTCKVCTDQGCGMGYYRQSNKNCTPCGIIPDLLTESYTTSCDDPCDDGLWGSDCEKHCEEGCVHNICNRWTGVCSGNCTFCHTGYRCQHKFENCECSSSGTCKCMGSRYGTGCQEVCFNKCLHKQCNDIGDCVAGCEPGWYGRKCDSEIRCSTCRYSACSEKTSLCDNGCTTGYTGMMCNTTCSRYCLNDECNQRTKLCDKGCKPGRYGDQCNVICPVKCKYSTCLQSNGRCARGCITGYSGEQCENTCPAICQNNKCRQEDGRCEDGCKSGWYGYKCNRRCPTKCGTNSCMRSDGACHGCMEGYKGSHCSASCSGQCIVCDQYSEQCSSCNPGWYGPTCDEYCSTCIENKCNSTNGYCEIGCRSGYFGHTCKTNCSTECKDHLCDRTSSKCTEGCNFTTFGEFCNNTCSDHCYKRLCNTRLGNISCTRGCVNGWWGDYCDINCPSDCERCDKSSGTCILLKCKGYRIGKDCISTNKNVENVVILWVIVPSLIIMVLIVVTVYLLKGKSSLSCFAKSRPAGIYLSPIPYEDRHEVYVSSGTSDHTYASIGNENGIAFEGQSDGSYEPVGPFPNGEGDLRFPLQEGYVSSGTSENAYASIPDYNGSENGHNGQSDSLYEEVGQRLCYSQHVDY